MEQVTGDVADAKLLESVITADVHRRTLMERGQLSSGVKIWGIAHVWCSPVLLPFMGPCQQVLWRE